MIIYCSEETWYIEREGEVDKYEQMNGGTSSKRTIRGCKAASIKESCGEPCSSLVLERHGT